VSEVFANNYQTTVSDGGDGIDSSQTTIGLADAPPAALAAGTYRLLIDSEIIIATGVSGSSATGCTRGAEGTAAAAHAEAAPVTHIITAGALANLGGSGATISSGAYASLPAAGNAGNLYLPTDSPHSLIRDNGASWDHLLPGIGLVTPPDDSDFSWVNQGSASVDASGGTIRLETPNEAGDNVRMRVRTHTSGDKHTIIFGGSIRFANYTQFGVCFYETTSTEVITFGQRATSEVVAVLHWNSPSSYASAPFDDPYLQKLPAGLFAWQIEDDGSDLYFRHSYDGGRSFVTVYSEAVGSFLTPDRVGIFVRARSSGAVDPAGLVLYSWKVE
jgi:hypothetical protein